MNNLPSPIKYNELTHTVYASSRQHAYTYIQQIGRKLKSMNAKIREKITDSWECGREHNLRFWWRWHQVATHTHTATYIVSSIILRYYAPICLSGPLYGTYFHECSFEDGYIWLPSAAFHVTIFHPSVLQAPFLQLFSFSDVPLKEVPPTQLLTFSSNVASLFHWCGSLGQSPSIVHPNQLSCPSITSGHLQMF